MRPNIKGFVVKHEDWLAAHINGQAGTCRPISYSDEISFTYKNIFHVLDLLKIEDKTILLRLLDFQV